MWRISIAMLYWPRSALKLSGLAVWLAARKWQQKWDLDKNWFLSYYLSNDLNKGRLEQWCSMTFKITHRLSTPFFVRLRHTHNRFSNDLEKFIFLLIHLSQLISWEKFSFCAKQNSLFSTWKAMALVRKRKIIQFSLAIKVVHQTEKLLVKNN